MIINQFKLYCEGIESFLNRLLKQEITHIIVTTSGKKIKCYESTELYSDETRIIIVKSLNRLKQKIITIDYNNIEYVIEKYNDNTWNQILNISNMSNDDEIIEDRLYG